MITLLKKSDFKKSLWKNGKGTTNQIAIFPSHATIEADDFIWRISSAQVEQANSFSQFKNSNRWLIVWNGDGLLLNGTPLLPHEPLHFSGEEIISCDLINGKAVTDLGIIYKKNKAQTNLTVLHLNSSKIIELDIDNLHFLFLANGSSCQINGVVIKTGDFLQIRNEKKLSISSEFNISLTLYLFTISLI